MVADWLFDCEVHRLADRGIAACSDDSALLCRRRRREGGLVSKPGRDCLVLKEWHVGTCTLLVAKTGLIGRKTPSYPGSLGTRSNPLRKFGLRADFGSKVERR